MNIENSVRRTIGRHQSSYYNAREYSLSNHEYGRMHEEYMYDSYHRTGQNINNWDQYYPNTVHEPAERFSRKRKHKNISRVENEPTPDENFDMDIMRFFDQGRTKLHCELCDLSLSSEILANEHYNGRRHRLVAAKVSKPSGTGFYDEKGKWIRTGTKFQATKNDINSQPNKDVIELNVKSNGKPSKPKLKDTSLFCTICEIRVSAASEWEMHINGSKHTKKLKLSTDVVAATPVTEKNSISNALLSSDDLSLYRTPSGQYYCATCNLAINSIESLTQHLDGKKHLKRISIFNKLQVPVEVEKQTSS